MRNHQNLKSANIEITEIYNENQLLKSSNIQYKLEVKRYKKQLKLGKDAYINDVADLFERKSRKLMRNYGIMVLVVYGLIFVLPKLF